MSRLRIAVVGAGHLGRIHARLLSELPQVHLTAVVDPDKSARETVARQHEAQAFANLKDAYSHMDAAILAAPTFLHPELGHKLLERGIHTLIEKPLAPTREEADDLIATAEKNDCVLQVGHVERFSPAVVAATPFIDRPGYIEARRLSGFSFRCLDVGVVMDLMIHDIDLILNWVDSPVESVAAYGDAIMDRNEDLVQARLTFANGCIANLSASRVAMQPERTMMIHGPANQIQIDFANRTVDIIRPTADIIDRSFQASSLDARERTILSERLFQDYLVHESLDVAEANPLQDEQRDFIAAVQIGRTPRVTGEAGRDAIFVAEQVLAAVEAQRQVGSATPAIYTGKAA